MTLARSISIVLLLLAILAVTVPIAAQDTNVDLLASITSEVTDQGTLILHYPEDWVAQDSGSGELTVASRHAVLDGTQSGDFTGLQSRDVVGGVERLRVEQYTGWDLTTEASPAEVIAGLATTADEPDNLFLGRVEEFDAHGVPAGIAIGTITIEEQVYGIIITTITLNEQIVGGYLIAPKAESGDYIAIARAMISQVEFRPANTMTQSISATIPDMGTIILHLPEAWASETDQEGLISLGSSPATLAMGLADDLYQMALGDAAGIVTVFPESELSMMGMDQDGSPLDLITAITGDIATGSEVLSASISDAEPLEATGRAAAIASGTIRSEEGVAGVILVAFKVDGGMGLLIFAVHQDEVHIYHDLAQAVIADLEFFPEGKEAINLSQHLTAEIAGVGEYSLHYPAGWASQTVEGASLIVANSQSTLEKVAAEAVVPFQTGEVAVVAIIVPETLYAMLDLGADPHPTEAIEVFAQLVVEDGDDTEVNVLSEPEPIELGGRAAAIATGTSTDGGVTYGAVFAAIAVDGGLGFVVFVTHPDEVADYADLARAMTGAFEFIPEGAEETKNLSQSITAIVESIGEYTLHYPEGWVGQFIEEAGTLAAANNQVALDKVNAAEVYNPVPGEISVFALVLSEFAFSIFSIEEGGTMVDAITAFIPLITDDENTTADFAIPEPFDANGRSAALMVGTVTEHDIVSGGILVAVEVEGGIGVLIFMAHPDELANHMDLVRAMTGAFEFTPE